MYPATERVVHAPGSLTNAVADSEVTAMRWFANRLGSVLHAMPHGEVERAETWLLPAILRVKQLPGFVVDGDDPIRKYEDVLNYARYVGRDKDMEIPTSVFGFAEEARRAVDALHIVRGNYHIVAKRDLWLQVGIGHWVDLLAFSMGDDALKNAVYQAAFMKALAQEARDIYDICEGRVVFQIESPKSLLNVQGAQGERERRDVVAFMAQAMAMLVQALPEGAEVVVHLCRGDFNHTAWPIDWSDLSPMVMLANAVWQAWPHDTHVLRFIHLPMASGNIAPVAGDDEHAESFYAPLADLVAKGRYVAGIVHETVSGRHNRSALSAAADALGRPFDATGMYCGMGRMTRHQAEIAFVQLQTAVGVGGS